MAGKKAGMDAAAEARKKILELGRMACFVAAKSRIDFTATADDASQWLFQHGYGSLGNAAGSLFQRGDWVFTGQWVASQKVSNHGHQNRIWRLRKTSLGR